MDNTREILDVLSRILSYPKEEYPQHVRHCRNLCERPGFGNDELRGSLLAALDRFTAATDGLTTGELEELYTRTFDINPVSSLEIGWHLYGETYERGTFLVEMRDLLRRSGVEESSELPDHLTHALLAVGRMEGEEAAAFVSKRMLKATGMILEGFAGKDNPYAHILIATKLLLAETCERVPHQEEKSE